MPTFTTTAEEQAAQRDQEIAAYTADRSQLNDERNRQANETAGKAYQQQAAREYREQQQNEAAMAARELQAKVNAAELRVSQLQSAINNPESREIERELADAERSIAGKPLREGDSKSGPTHRPPAGAGVTGAGPAGRTQSRTRQRTGASGVAEKVTRQSDYGLRKSEVVAGPAHVLIT